MVIADFSTYCISRSYPVTRSYSLKSALPAFALGFLALGLVARPAFAATVTTPFGVSATVQATCLVSATALAFGTYTGVVANSTSTVSVTCTNTTPYNVGLSAGLATGATVTTRKMTGPASALLNYCDVLGLLAYGQLGPDDRHRHRGRNRQRLRPGDHRIRPDCGRTVCRSWRIHRHDHRDGHLLVMAPTPNKAATHASRRIVAAYRAPRRFSSCFWRALRPRHSR